MPDPAAVIAPAEKSADFFTTFFLALEAAGVGSVILHSYEAYPHRIGSDVDYAVRNGDISRTMQVLRETCARKGWVLAQVLRHEVFARYCVALNPRNPREVIKLDVCSHYVGNGCFLLTDEELLTGRRKHGDFFVPSVQTEFAYVLAKALTKKKDRLVVAARLRELHDRAPGECARAFARLTGLPGEECGHLWDESNTAFWTHLGERMKARRGYSPALKLRELGRRLKRVLHPTGLVVGLLGADGSGKSTLLANLLQLLEPCFRREQTLHFRPFLRGRRREGIVREPHSEPPRGKILSWAKVCYYYIDWLAGYLLMLRPMKARSTLVLCDRTFDDLSIDPRRYRLQWSRFLTGLLRRLLPTPDLILVMTGTPEVLHQRKNELTVGEIARQQRALGSLADRNRHMVKLNVDAGAEEVATSAAFAVLTFLAARCDRRKAWE